jgi:hypothetical protein
MRPFGVTITWLQRTVTSTPGYGNDVVSWTPTDIYGAAVFPGVGSKRFMGTREHVQGQDLISGELTIVIPVSYAVEPTDRFIVSGETYEVDGQPAVHRNPFTGSTSQELRLNLVTG